MYEYRTTLSMKNEFTWRFANQYAGRLMCRGGLVMLPLSALFGGTFLMLAELISRTVMAPTVIPVGAVTALVGAPFFAVVYFRGRKMR